MVVLVLAAVAAAMTAWAAPRVLHGIHGWVRHLPADDIAHRRALLGTLVEPRYTAVYETLATRPGEQFPLIFDDADQSLEAHVAALNSDISGQGAVATAIAPLLGMFDQANPGCRC